MGRRSRKASSSPRTTRRSSKPRSAPRARPSRASRPSSPSGARTRSSRSPSRSGRKPSLTRRLPAPTRRAGCGRGKNRRRPGRCPPGADRENGIDAEGRRGEPALHQDLRAHGRNDRHANRREGQTLVSSQQAPVILRIADLKTMTVQTQVSEADVPKVKAGMPVYFTTLGQPNRRCKAPRARWCRRRKSSKRRALQLLFDVENTEAR